MHERDTAHFAFDDERKARRQKAFEQQSVDIARVVRDDNAGSRGQAFETGDPRFRARDEQGQPDDRRGVALPAFGFRRDADRGEGRQDADREHGNGIQPVEQVAETGNSLYVNVFDNL